MTDDAVDHMLERMAREDQEELDRAHGQQILEIATAKGRGVHPLLEAINRAHQAKAEETDKQ